MRRSRTTQKESRHVRRPTLRWASWAGLALILSLLRPPLESVDVPMFELGQVADRTVIAPFPFQVTKSKADLDRERAAAANREPPVFRLIAGARGLSLGRLDALKHTLPASAHRDSLQAAVTPDQALSRSTRQLLSTEDTRTKAFAIAGQLLGGILSGWIAPDGVSLTGAKEFVTVLPDSSERIVPADSLLTVDRALSLLSSQARNLLPDDELMARAVYEIASPFIAPTAILDPASTEVRRARAMESVSPFTGTMLAGEVIVEAHYRLTQADLDELRSLQEAYAARASAAGAASTALPVVGHLLWTGFFLVMLAASLRGLSAGILRSPGDTALVAVLLSLLAVAGYAARWWIRLPPAAVPLSAFAILATVFFDTRVGFGVTTLGLLLSASHFRFELSGLVGPLAGALVAVFWVRRLRRRRDFLLAALWVFLASAGAGLSLGLIFGSNGAALLRGVILSAGNAVASLFLVVVAFPVLETLFHRTTDLRLLELLDMNHLLLRQLALEAPGTYHHSIVVGNLAEAACDAIGANALLARVGSYYHDIGKLTKPQYFAENQGAGDNPHDRLTPKMSALVIASHVKEGLRMADKAGLPPAIGSFIAEHHGTGQISFFYKKMKEQNPDAKINPEEFSYSGPKPSSRETAVVMLADSAEGATRALDEPNATRIRQIVQRVIHERLTEGQLDESPLNFRDLERIREAFAPILMGVHHRRVKYPEGSRETPGSSEDNPL
ncbi:HDIG domain-containing protein [Candidatus Fermentibacteria bacterium]|nr:HDIG domain-containing protein [Candidatus Fermentibacteria bacterium]